MQHLPANSFLQNGKYRIIQKLGQGGFGITYLAENVFLQEKVAIKEFFFNEYCDRDASTSHVTVPKESNREFVERFKQKFIKEARTIYRLNHPNIVRFHDIFEENGTAYYVMEYIEGESLERMVSQRGSIPAGEALGYIKEVASALTYIHSKNMNHLDIKPDNIMRRSSDGKVVLIDFGVAKQYDAETSQGTTTTPVGISHGYSPLEQYRHNGVQTFSPQSDVYALAATLYKLISGYTPPEAVIVQDEGLPHDPLLQNGVAPHVIDAIEQAMQSKSRRTPSVEAFIYNIEHDPKATRIIKDPPPVPDGGGETGTGELPPKKTDSNTKMMWIGGVAALIVIAVAVFFVAKGSGSSEKVAEQQQAKENVTASISSPTGTASDHGYVDLGLSVKWATCNVGASSPSDYGDYYAWGETSTKSRYDWDNCFDCLDSSGDSWRTYKIGGQTRITPGSGHDTVRENWGGTWRMPTNDELEELNKRCTWTWTTMNGHNGYQVTGPNGNSIFLPAAGCRYGADFRNVGSYGAYWSSTLSSSYSSSARYLYFNSDFLDTYYFSRSNGSSVRPVIE